MYKINEFFLSVQGEGKRTGTSNVFVRFSHCNLKCNIEEHGFDCDTDFTGFREVSLSNIVEQVHVIGGDCKSIIFTGGEPMLQLDEELCNAFKNEGYYLAVETNGTVESDVYDLLDWVTVSPKTAEHTLRASVCHELKYVLPDTKEPPKPKLSSEYYLLSPVFNGNEIDRNSLRWCTKIVKECRIIGKSQQTWELSVQNHKFWKAR